MKQRRVILSFPEVHGRSGSLLSGRQKVLDGVNIRFDVKINGEANVPAECFCDVYNLNRDDIKFLTTSAAYWLDKPTLMQLYAGYDNDVKMIFSGLIMNATPDGNPDVAVKIRAISGQEWMASSINFAKSNIKIFDLLQYAAQEMGYPVNCPDWIKRQNENLNKVIDDYSFTGTKYDLLREIQAMVGGFDNSEQGVNFSIINNELVVSSNAPPTGSRLLISKDSGMVGYPQPTGVGCNVKMLLNTRVKPGDWVRIQSNRISIVNRDFKVTAIRYHGELRGNEFYTTLECSHNDAGK